MPYSGGGDRLVLPEANAFSGRALGVWSAYQRRNNFFRRWYRIDTPAQWQRDKLKTRPAAKASAHKTMTQWRDMLRLTALIIGLLAPAAGAAPPVAVVPTGVAPAVQRQEVRLAVAQGGGRWILGWQTHDAALVAALFADDGVELGRGGVVTRGRRAVRALVWRDRAGAGEPANRGFVADGRHSNRVGTVHLCFFPRAARPKAECQRGDLCDRMAETKEWAMADPLGRECRGPVAFA